MTVQQTLPFQRNGDVLLRGNESRTYLIFIILEYTPGRYVHSVSRVASVLL